MSVLQLLRKSVLFHPDRAATVWRGRTRSWAEVGDRVSRAAAGLRGLGVGDGDRVAVLAMNSDSYLELFFASAWAGGVIVPLNTRWSTRELADAMTDCTPTVLLVDETFQPVLADVLAATEVRPTVVLLDGTDPDQRGPGAPDGALGSYESLIARHEPDVAASLRSGDDLYALFYTGGTTGRSRGVMLSHRNFVTSSIIWVSTLAFRTETRYLHAVGFFHLAGAAPLVALTMVGGTHVLTPKFEAGDILRTIDGERVNYCLFVPTMIRMLLSHPDFEKYDLTSLRDIEYGASPMPTALLEEALARLPGVEFRQGYGCTEATALVTCLQAEHHRPDAPQQDVLRSAGRAAMGVEVRIVDEAGTEVPHGVVGEIAVQGDTVMLGYWNQPEETARVLRDGWLHTGDGAWMSERGYVYIVDRMKDMIVSGGENVYSSEVEQAIYRHPAVKECAVIGIPDERWGEAVHVEVVPHPGRTVAPEEIIAHAHTLIAGYKCPKSVSIRAEALPLTAAGKIHKPSLRAPYWQNTRKQVS